MHTSALISTIIHINIPPSPPQKKLHVLADVFTRKHFSEYAYLLK